MSKEADDKELREALTLARRKPSDLTGDYFNKLVAAANDEDFPATHRRRCMLEAVLLCRGARLSSVARFEAMAHWFDASTIRRLGGGSNLPFSGVPTPLFYFRRRLGPADNSGAYILLDDVLEEQEFLSKVHGVPGLPDPRIIGVELSQPPRRKLAREDWLDLRRQGEAYRWFFHRESVSVVVPRIPIDEAFRFLSQALRMEFIYGPLRSEEPKHVDLDLPGANVWELVDAIAECTDCNYWLADGKLYYSLPYPFLGGGEPGNISAMRAPLPAQPPVQRMAAEDPVIDGGIRASESVQGRSAASDGGNDGED